MPDKACSVQQVAQAVISRRTARQSCRGMQRATGEYVAIGRTMDQFDALALPAELNGVFANDVTGTQAGVARHRTGLFGHGTERERGSRRRVLFLAVVRFDDVAIPAVEH